MKLNILQQDLWPALQAVSRSCGVRSQLPVLGNILLQTEEGRLKLSATNLEIGVVKTVKADVVEEGEITVPAKTFVEMIGNLSTENLEISSTADQISIITPTFSSQMNGISANEFPTIPLTGKQSISIDPKILAKALPQIVFASAAEDGRPVLTGILTEIKDKKMQLVATDGYRLAHKSMDVAETAAFKALVPRKTFEEIVRLISEEEADQVEIATSDDQNQIIFKFGGTVVSSRLIEGNFPSWEKIIPTDIKARVIIDRGEVLKAVKLASVFARSEANIVKIQNLADKLVLTSEAKELGSQKKEVDAKSEGEEIKIAFNAKFLQDALGAFSASQATLEFSGNLSAAAIKPIGEEGLQYIIMPVNLS